MCFFSVCVCVCVSLARRHGEEHASRGRALHWECAPRRNSKATCAKLCRILKNLHILVTYPMRLPKKSTQIGDLSMRLSPQTHNLKKDFSPLPCDPPLSNLYKFANFATFQKTFRIFSANSTWPREHLCANLAGFSHNFPRLTQNTCVIASHVC